MPESNNVYDDFVEIVDTMLLEECVWCGSLARCSNGDCGVCCSSLEDSETSIWKEE